MWHGGGCLLGVALLSACPPLCLAQQQSSPASRGLVGVNRVAAASAAKVAPALPAGMSLPVLPRAATADAAVTVPAAAQPARKSAVVQARDILQGLLAKDFLDPVYSRPFLKSLSAPAAMPFADQIGWKARTPAQLSRLAARFQPPPALRGKLSVRLEPVMSAKEKEPHLVLLAVAQRLDGDAAGYFSVLIKRDKSAGLKAEVHSVYFDRADAALAGMAPAILEFLRRDVYPGLGVVKETLKADHAGRYVWAKQGFQFEPTYWFKDDNGKGQAIRLAELARRNFARFMQANGLKISDLELAGRPVASLEDMKTPNDFASVVHRRRKKLRTRPFVLGALQEPADLDVGKAFMLGDYRPRDGNYVLSKAGTKFSTTAMPYWNGTRDVGR